MELFAPDREATATLGLGPTRIIHLPARFSFHEDSVGTVKTLRMLASHARDPGTHYIWVDQTDAEHTGVGADAVMSALALEAHERFRVKFNGRFPTNPELMDIVRATGVPEALGMTKKGSDEFTVLSLLRGRKTPKAGRRSTEKEVVLTDCTSYLNECLSHYGYSLSYDGEDLFNNLLGEIITNAEDHSNFGEWWMRGYLHRPEGQDYGRCHFVIFNFGNTIFESMQKLPSGSRLRREIESLVEKHNASGWFRRGKWTPESLWTVYALQGGVSRFHTGDEMGHRGTGTVRMIEFLYELGQSDAAPTPPQMVIVSGGTQIRFDGPYRMVDQVTLSGQVRPVIAFNRENDLGRAPDARYVRKFKGFFPGTIVSLHFYLDRRHLDAIKGTHV